MDHKLDLVEISLENLVVDDVRHVIKRRAMNDQEGLDIN